MKVEPTIRYADILLLYAEALNNLTGSYEEPSWDNSKTYTGYTRNYVPVTIHRRDLHIGDLVEVTITGVENADHCIAE